MVENNLAQRIAMMENTITERVSALRREIRAIRASLEARDLQAKVQTEQEGEKALNGDERLSQDRLSTLTQRVADLERSLTETADKVRDIRSRMQDLNNARAIMLERCLAATRRWYLGTTAPSK